MENKDNLLEILRDYISELEKYEDAIENGDDDELKELLKAGSESKVTADAKDPVLTMTL